MIEIKEYWSNNWKANTKQYEWSYKWLVKTIDKNERILDIGCGHNPLKEHFPNLYGIDPYIETNTDEVVSWEDFVPKQDFDRYFILGSINFGTHYHIDKYMKKLGDMVKPGQTVHWRQNPWGNDHPWEGSEAVPFYDWDITKNIHFCNKYSFRLEKWIYDHGKRNDRNYVEWVKI